jgi:transcriptional regulator with XRE-family HTH domain
MARHTSEPQKPVSPARRKYMAELLLLREESGMSLGELSEVTKFDRSYLNKLERGIRLGDRATARHLDEVYGTKRALQNLWDLAKDEAYLGRYQRYMALSAKARVMEMYVPQTIPGLLQTEEYARELIWSTPHTPEEEDALEEQLVLRLNRQEILRRSAASSSTNRRCGGDSLRRPMRDREAWRRQLQRLLDDVQLPNVTLQVLPFQAGLCDVLGGSLVILRLPDGTAAAYVEGSKSGEVIEEPDVVEQLRLSYDRVRDLALSPRDSVEFIQSLLKDV